ncbi:MAG: hypothetical protein JEY97_06925 [Bacteroidales bacterium]|nr:hypothetical protein [Bacteroidales bacterium]
MKNNQTKSIFTIFLFLLCLNAYSQNMHLIQSPLFQIIGEKNNKEITYLTNDVSINITDEGDINIVVGIGSLHSVDSLPPLNVVYNDHLKITGNVPPDDLFYNVHDKQNYTSLLTFESNNENMEKEFNIFITYDRVIKNRNVVFETEINLNDFPDIKIKNIEPEVKLMVIFDILQKRR